MKNKLFLRFIVLICDCLFHSVLLQIPADIDAKDLDGWTPLMAAAHWGQEESCKVLVENFASMEDKNLSVSGYFSIWKIL